MLTALRHWIVPCLKLSVGQICCIGMLNIDAKIVYIGTICWLALPSIIIFWKKLTSIVVCKDALILHIIAMHGYELMCKVQLNAKRLGYILCIYNKNCKTNQHIDQNQSVEASFELHWKFQPWYYFAFARYCKIMYLLSFKQFWFFSYSS